VALISIYKRLRGFEALIRDEPLAAIEVEVMVGQQ
jgi:ABC-type long-subunit fatty acid transport system fused permease/ATPase subunit